MHTIIQRSINFLVVIEIHALGEIRTAHGIVFFVIESCSIYLVLMCKKHICAKKVVFVFFLIKIYMF